MVHMKGLRGISGHTIHCINVCCAKIEHVNVEKINVIISEKVQLSLVKTT